MNILLVDTNNIELDELLNSSYLTDTDKKELSNIKNERSKKEKTASLVLKNKYIKDYYLSEYGKPLSNKTFFNISHSSGVVVFVESDKPIGIDIEKIEEVKEKLISYISSQEEKDYITNTDQFYEIWTSKESLAKCLGIGLKDKIKEIPSLPINGVKIYRNKEYYSKAIKYNDFMISLTRESKEEFDIQIILESL